MAGIHELRPLPPSWLLVAAARSGTPIHDHPHTVAWNVLLSGCKLWAILPPGCGREVCVCVCVCVCLPRNVAALSLRESCIHERLVKPRTAAPAFFY